MTLPRGLRPSDMTTTRVFLSVLVFLAATMVAQSAPEGSRKKLYSDDQQAVADAYKRNDTVAYRDALLRFHKDFPGKSRPLRQLGLLELESKHEPAAIDWLRQYADRGLVVDLTAAPLAALTASPAFASLHQMFEQNAKAAARATTAFQMPAADLIAEDVTYDPASRRFFVSSVHGRKILACNGSGICTDFVKTSDTKPPLWAVLAVRADSKRNVLWATTASMVAESDHVAAEDGSSAVLKFDLTSGRLLKRYEVGDQVKRAFGDMAVSSRGDAYVADGLSGNVYVILAERDQLERLVPEGTFISPQTPALSADEQTLYVPDYTSGIARVDLKTRAVTWLESDVPAAMDGIDGLYWHEGWLVAVQNGTEPERVAAYHLGAKGSVDRVEVLEANTPGLGDPTHGVWMGSDFYFVVNSGWDRLQDDGTLKPGKPAEVHKLSMESGTR